MHGRFQITGISLLHGGGGSCCARCVPSCKFCDSLEGEHASPLQLVLRSVLKLDLGLHFQDLDLIVYLNDTRIGMNKVLTEESFIIYQAESSQRL